MADRFSLAQQLRTNSGFKVSSDVFSQHGILENVSYSQLSAGARARVDLLDEFRHARDRVGGGATGTVLRKLGLTDINTADLDLRLSEASGEGGDTISDDFRIAKALQKASSSFQPEEKPEPPKPTAPPDQPKATRKVVPKASSDRGGQAVTRAKTILRKKAMKAKSGDGELRKKSILSDQTTTGVG
jgi:hypothetical protein